MDLNFKDETQKYNFDDLLKIVKILRAPGGCPWDREQTHESLRRNIMEEGYELIEAIDGGNGPKIADESGDLLLQIIFHAVIGEENNEYSMDDVTDAISRKLIHRHPHVFGNVKANNSAEVLKNWDAIKRKDRKQQTITEELRGVSQYLPALMRAEKIQKKAEKAGYSYSNINIGDHEKYSAKQYGQILFSAVKQCRNNGVDPELALREYTESFIKEFEKYENNREDNKK